MYHRRLGTHPGNTEGEGTMNIIRGLGVMRVVALVGAMAALHAATLRGAEVISDVTAKANGESSGFSRYATNAVNGIGLTGDAHTNVPNGYMWQVAGTSGWFRVNLDRECYVETIRVWNYNEPGWTARGVGVADIYTAVDPGTNAIGEAGWELLEADRVFTQAPGLNTYNTPDVITVNRTALYIGLKIKNSLGGNNIGLSEVQVIGTPVVTRLVNNVTATASTQDTGNNRYAAYAVNGSGLVGKAHDNIATNMWMSTVGAPGWFKVDLGQPYTLKRIDVWNYNEGGWISRGVGTAHIYTAMTNSGTDPGGAGWTQVKTNQYFAGGTSATGYDTPTRLLMNHRARYVGFEILTSQPGGNRIGFSEVQFQAAPPAGTIIFVR